MQHYDASNGSPEAQVHAEMAAKEASYVQAVGYVPTTNISNQDWEDMVLRNEISEARGGEYRANPYPGRNGTMV